VCRRQYSAFDGKGARLAGGRWNHRGAPVVYTSATLSLAALEYFVNLDPGAMPDDLVAVPADLPESAIEQLERVPGFRLPRGWRAYPAPAALADPGTAWVQAARRAVLSVPSAVIPVERNYLINPVHPQSHQVRVGKAEAFSLDPRMWK